MEEKSNLEKELNDTSLKRMEADRKYSNLSREHTQLKAQYESTKVDSIVTKFTHNRIN